MKWLGVGEKPYKLFFILLKVKQQYESTHSLLKDNTCIEDKEEILKEIVDFYGKLFQTIGNNAKIQEARREILQFTTTRVTKVQVQDIERMRECSPARKYKESSSPYLKGRSLV